MDGWGSKMLVAVETAAEMAARGFGLEPDAFTRRMRMGPHLLAPTGASLTQRGLLALGGTWSSEVAWLLRGCNAKKVLRMRTVLSCRRSLQASTGLKAYQCVSRAHSSCLHMHWFFTSNSQAQLRRGGRYVPWPASYTLCNCTGADLGAHGQRGAVLAGWHYDLNFLSAHGKSRFPGLAVWLQDGRRLPVSIPDGCLLLQAGKQLEWLTGGHVRAGMHEVLSPICAWREGNFEGVAMAGSNAAAAQAAACCCRLASSWSGSPAAACAPARTRRGPPLCLVQGGMGGSISGWKQCCSCADRCLLLQVGKQRGCLRAVVPRLHAPAAAKPCTYI